MAIRRSMLARRFTSVAWSNHHQLPLKNNAFLVSNTKKQRRWNSNVRNGSSPKKPNEKPLNGLSQPPHEQPKAFAIGSLAGLLGSLAGMGGGFVMVPLMTSPLLLRLSQHSAHGTSLFAVTTTGLAGALGYGLHTKNEESVVQLDIAAVLAACGMITARLGAQATGKLSEKALKTALGIFMLCIAPLVPAKDYFAQLNQNKRTKEENDNNNRTSRLVSAGTIGLGSGFLAGLFGVGGGAIVVPALALLTDMSHHSALGTSLCAMTLPAMVGTFTHYQKGNVAMRIAPALALGSFVGAFAGGRIGLSLPEKELRYGFSGLMLVLGTKTLFRI